MRFIYEDDPRLIARQLCFTAQNIQLGLLQKGGHSVLPYLPEEYRKCVYLPDLDYTDKFWSEFKNTKLTNYYQKFPDEMESFVENKLEKHTPDIKINTDKKTKEWQEISKEFLNDIANIFGSNALDNIEAVRILHTPYGTPGSFSPFKAKSGKYIFPLCLRYDMPVAFIGNMILSSFYITCYNKSSEVGEIGYYERMAAIRFLRERSILSKYFPTVKKYTSKDIKRFINDSDKYLTKLGINNNDLISLTDGEIVINRKISTHLFSKQEFSLIKSFIENRNHLLNYDAIGKALWADKVDEKFSLYAIAKVVENIRKKQKEAGLKRDRLKTIRKEGYVWVE